MAPGSRPGSEGSVQPPLRPAHRAKAANEQQRRVFRVCPRRHSLVCVRDEVSQCHVLSPAVDTWATDAVQECAERDTLCVCVAGDQGLLNKCPVEKQASVTVCLWLLEAEPAGRALFRLPRRQVGPAASRPVLSGQPDGWVRGLEGLGVGRLGVRSQCTPRSVSRVCRFNLVHSMEGAGWGDLGRHLESAAWQEEGSERRTRWERLAYSGECLCHWQKGGSPRPEVDVSQADWRRGGGARAMPCPGCSAPGHPGSCVCLEGRVQPEETSPRCWFASRAGSFGKGVFRA